ncbi:MAG TPA: hypothetical protein VGK74_11895 [Symbiobacteriaceae bacterium]
MGLARPADTFVVRVRRERGPGAVQPPVERWQVEHVQTGLKVYVHGLEDAMSVIRSSLSRTPKPAPDEPAPDETR